MFKVDIDGKQYEAEVTFYTARLYESEFMGDLIQDFFGKQEFTDESNPSLFIDFTKINWTATTKVLWAALKTADESTKGYIEWMKASKGMNTFIVRDQLATEIADCFFRAETTEEDTPEEELE